jgi:gas vesicle protein
MSSERRDAASYLGWFFFGAAAGAVGAVLLTPRTGRETRELLAERGGDLARRAQERSEELARHAQRFAHEAQELTGEWLDRGREVFEEKAQRLKSAFEAGKDAMREEIHRGVGTPPRG